MKIQNELRLSDFGSVLESVFTAGAEKARAIEGSGRFHELAPVFTIDGSYVAQGWTEWTQGFQFGAALLCFDALGAEDLLEIGRRNTAAKMDTHVSSFGVHDHGFNNVSTYGNLRRLMLEQKIPFDERELQWYETALKASGAVQAYRWTEAEDGGYIYSFNGPHSLFCDTLRSLRSLALAHHLGHVLLDENDERVSLLDRLLQHAGTTAQYNVYYGGDRDIYDVRGRVAHESIFNVNDGKYRCPSTQQGYSPFTTWTRGLAWIMLGYAEQIEFLETRTDAELDEFGGREANRHVMLEAARASCDFYIRHMPADGIPYWDTGAPGLVHMPGYLERPADPLNKYEPVDSSAAAIAAQGLLRLGRILQTEDTLESQRYWKAGLTVARTLFAPPYLDTSNTHEGLLLHSVYHRPRGWDHLGAHGVPHGEACMWGDYHLLELALYLQRVRDDQRYYVFWGA